MADEGRVFERAGGIVSDRDGKGRDGIGCDDVQGFIWKIIVRRDARSQV